MASCASMKDSLQLGAGVGAFSGAAATYSAHQSMGRSAKLEDVAVGAGVAPHHRDGSASRSAGAHGGISQDASGIS